jgi:lysophospholipase L1-like esterase
MRFVDSAQHLLGALLLALACLCASPIQAQDALGKPNPSSEDKASALSPQCDAPNADIATPVPLANMANVLGRTNKLTILAIGSSSTYGVGASVRGKTYPAQLEQILEKSLQDVEVKIINRGVSGEVAANTADRLMNEVALTHPDLVLWQLGTNDALAHIAPNEFETIVRTAITRLKKRKIDIVLVGLQYTPRFVRDESYIAIREALRKVATDENVLYVRRYEAMQFIAKTRANQDMLASDDFHLNDLGYQCMAEHIAQAVVTNLFLRRRDKAAISKQ